MMLFAETPELVAYKEVVDGMITVIFESIHSETFSISAQAVSYTHLTLPTTPYV